MQVKGLDPLSPLQATSHKPGHTESLFYNLSPDGKKVLKLGDKFKKLYDIKTFVASPVFMEALRFDQGSILKILSVFPGTLAHPFHSVIFTSF